MALKTLTADEKTAGAKAFYGSAYGRAKDSAKLDSAFGMFNMAMNSESAGIVDRALNSAAKTEAEAFA